MRRITETKPDPARRGDESTDRIDALGDAKDLPGKKVTMQMTDADMRDIHDTGSRDSSESSGHFEALEAVSDLIAACRALIAQVGGRKAESKVRESFADICESQRSHSLPANAQYPLPVPPRITAEESARFAAGLR